MKNEFEFKNGKSASIKELFSSGYKFVIPDMQRDYCWGSKLSTKDSNGKSIAFTFVYDLLQKFKEGKKDLQLGFLYCYEEPKGCLQLCDGQQRLTTLFLLLGLLKRKSGADDINLKTKDGDPCIFYEIRESTQYFLSDLTDSFFYSSGSVANDLCSVIKREKWYFADYNFDSSITNMIRALQDINENLSVLDIELREFVEFVFSLKFICYNLETRQNGEETFVIINTTGEPLTPTENIKPVLLSREKNEKIKASNDIWETWEQFFWENRKDFESKRENDTADNGILEFFRWVLLIECSKERGEEASKIFGSLENLALLPPFDEINEFFKAVKTIKEKGFIKDFKKYLCPNLKGNDITTWIKIIPVIIYLRKFPDATQQEVARVVSFFANIARKDEYDRSKNLPKLLFYVYNMKSKDIVSLLDNDKIEEFLGREEVVKLEILKKNWGAKRIEIETAFNEMQKSSYFKGVIQPLLEWSTRSTSSGSLSSENFEFDDFKKYVRTFKSVFVDWKSPDEKTDLDAVRRALLVYAPTDYCHFPFYKTNWTFCSNDMEWRTLIRLEENRNWLKTFFEVLGENQSVSTETLENMCQEEYKKPKNKRHTTSDLQYLLQYPRILQEMTKKRLYWEEGSSFGFWIILNGTKFTYHSPSLINYVFYLRLKEEKILGEYNNWEIDGYYWQSEKPCCWIHQKNNSDEYVCIYSSDEDNFYLTAKTAKPEKLEKLKKNGFSKSLENKDEWKSKEYPREDMPEMLEMVNDLKKALSALG